MVLSFCLIIVSLSQILKGGRACVDIAGTEYSVQVGALTETHTFLLRAFVSPSTHSILLVGRIKIIAKGFIVSWDHNKLLVVQINIIAI